MAATAGSRLLLPYKLSLLAGPLAVFLAAGNISPEIGIRILNAGVVVF
jgi:hypothetical protein